MSDKERFQRVFAPLHASPETLTEVIKMTEHTRQKPHIRRAAVLALAAALVLALAGLAYAADLGGIQRTVQLWIHGNQTDAVMTVEPGHYTLDYTDENGNAQQRGGGGVAIAEDGTERPLTEEEMMGMLNSPEVRQLEDGSVMVYYYGQALDITDKFDEDGVCYVQLNSTDGTLYMTIKAQGGYATSTSAYISPEDFS